MSEHWLFFNIMSCLNQTAFGDIISAFKDSGCIWKHSELTLLSQHFSYLPLNFRGWNPLISGNSCDHKCHLRAIFPHRFCIGFNFKSVFDQQKAVWFEIDFCVSCESYITILLTTDNGPLLSAKYCWNFTCDFTFRAEKTAIYFLRRLGDL